jgi:hypothetical protein
MLLLSAGAAREAKAVPCPAKIAAAFCAEYAAAGDTALLKARVVLDRSLWIPSKGGASNPLVAGAKALVAQYPLRCIDAPDSAYHPRYLDADYYGIDEYVYNNVAATKPTLEALKDDPRVEEIQPGCVKALSYVPMCDSFNVWPPAPWMSVRLHFRTDLESDTAAQLAFFDRYDLRDPEDTGTGLRPEILVRRWPIAFAIKRKDLERMAVDPAVRLLEPWHKDGPASSISGSARSGGTVWDWPGHRGGRRIPADRYRADGRKIPPRAAPRAPDRPLASPVP